MSILEIVLGVILIILAIAVTAVVLFQEGHEKSIGVITGSSGDTFLSKHNSRSIDTFLERWTSAIAISFFLVAIAVNIILYFHLFQ